jgi:hypothetical protein
VEVGTGNPSREWERRVASTERNRDHNNRQPSSKKALKLTPKDQKRFERFDGERVQAESSAVLPFSGPRAIARLLRI